MSSEIRDSEVRGVNHLPDKGLKDSTDDRVVGSDCVCRKGRITDLPAEIGWDTPVEVLGNTPEDRDHDDLVHVPGSNLNHFTGDEPEDRRGVEPCAKPVVEPMTKPVIKREDEGADEGASEHDDQGAEQLRDRPEG